jgi:hypothetical protein
LGGETWGRSALAARLAAETKRRARAVMTRYPDCAPYDLLAGEYCAVLFKRGAEIGWVW